MILTNGASLLEYSELLDNDNFLELFCLYLTIVLFNTITADCVVYHIMYVDNLYCYHIKCVCGG